MNKPATLLTIALLTTTSLYPMWSHYGGYGSGSRGSSYDSWDSREYDRKARETLARQRARRVEQERQEAREADRRKAHAAREKEMVAQSKLLKAVWELDAEGVKELLESGASLDEKIDFYGCEIPVLSAIQLLKKKLRKKDRRVNGSSSWKASKWDTIAGAIASHTSPEQRTYQRERACALRENEEKRARRAAKAISRSGCR